MMVLRPSPRPALQRGVASILVILALPVALLFTWFCIEYARVHRHAGRAKLAADAAALAAAARYAEGHEVARTDAIVAAGGHAGPKGPLTLVVADGPGGGGDLEFGDWDAESRSFTPNPDGGKAVRVLVRLSEDHPNGGIPMLLSGLFDIPPASLTQTSVALFRAPTHTTSMLLSDDEGSLLTVEGGARVRTRGGVSVPNDDAASISIAPEAVMDVPVLRAAGSVAADAADRIDGEVRQGVTIPADPFASADLPAIDGGAASADVEHDGAGTISLGPGVHGALSASAGVVVLAPGLHQFTGGIALRGTAVLELNDATVQLAEGASLELAGSATLRGTASPATPAWSGYAIIQRSGGVPWTFGNGSAVDVSGRVYAPGALLALSGDARFRAASAIVHSVGLSDSASLRLDADIDEIEMPGSQGRARLLR